ncbi:NHL repeat-containing protein [Aureivirga marina]|uniref:hypothetical protein n=1 Tax=Aureivirga marina TaxID=1182451 RepID=UPI0018C9C5F1|nr:hypothetical protein [Aureivirga marina]
MRKFLFILFVLIISCNEDEGISIPDPKEDPEFGSKETVITGLQNPYGIAFYNNELYVSQLSSENILSKINLNEEVKMLVPVITGSQDLNYLESNGSELFITNILGNAILELNLDNETPNLEIFKADVALGFPFAIEIVENTMFITGSLTDNILKIDLTNSDLTIETVTSNVNYPKGIAYYENQLFIAEEGQITKISLENPEVKSEVLSLESNPYDIKIQGNYLYIAQFDLGKIIRINITQESPFSEEVSSGLNGPVVLRFFQNELYVVEQESGEISKIKL